MCRAARQGDGERRWSGEHSCTLEAGLAFFTDEPDEWKVDEAVKYGLQLQMVTQESFELLKGETVSSQGGRELELLELKEEIGMLLEVRLQKDVVCSSRTQVAPICVAAVKLGRLSL